MVNETNQPYLYAGDDPVNGVDRDGDGGYGAYFDDQNAAENADYCHAHNRYCQYGNPSVAAVLATIAFAGAIVATIATDGATSELLYESTAVLFDEESTTVVSESVYLETASQTSALGQVAAGASLTASGVQSIRDCRWGSAVSCAIDAVTFGISATVTFSDLSAMQKVWTNLIASLPSGLSYLKTFLRSSSSLSLSKSGSCTI